MFNEDIIIYHKCCPKDTPFIIFDLTVRVSIQFSIAIKAQVKTVLNYQAQ